jgi:hypothetical protein
LRAADGRLTQANERQAETPIIVSGESEMAERNIKRGAVTVVLVTFVVSAASCGGTAPNEIQDRFLSSVSADSPNMEGSSWTEARHFDAYKQYRLLFD